VWLGGEALKGTLASWQSEASHRQGSSSTLGDMSSKCSLTKYEQAALSTK